MSQWGITPDEWNIFVGVQKEIGKLAAGDLSRQEEAELREFIRRPSTRSIYLKLAKAGVLRFSDRESE